MATPSFPLIDKLKALHSVPLCDGLPDRDLNLFANRGRLVEHRKGDLVFQQGDVPEAFYIILSGRLVISIQEAQRSSILAYLYGGDYFGEVALLTNEHHSASARVMNDAVLMVIPRDDFLEILERVPTIALRLSQGLSRRLRLGNRPSRDAGQATQILTVHSAIPTAGKTTFAVTLAAYLARELSGRPIVLDMSSRGEVIATQLHGDSRLPMMRFDDIHFAIEQRLQNEILSHPLGFDLLNVGYTDASDAAERIVVPLLSVLAERYRFIIVDLQAGGGRTALKTLTQSDVIYVLTGGDEQSIGAVTDWLGELRRIAPEVSDRMQILCHAAGGSPIDQDEQLLGRIAVHLPEDSVLTGRALSEELVRQLLVDRQSAYGRVVRQLARRLGGVQIGLALGSGAALGLAHIGVLKVMERESVPIDLIAGSSIGALLAACWAVGHSAAELEQMALEFSGMRIVMSRLIDISFPWSGFIQGRKVMRFLDRLLDDKTFADAQMPLYVVATDLRSRQETVFTKGLLADAVRASISIAGIFEPAKIGQTLYLDGGIVNPVPVTALQRAGATKVIAVSVLASPEEIAQREEQRRQAIRRRRELARRKSAWALWGFQVRQRVRDALTTNVFDVIMQAMQAMEYEIAETACRQADVMIRPTAPSAGWMEFYRAKRFIEHGEREAERMLPQIKQLVAHR